MAQTTLPVFLVSTALAALAGAAGGYLSAPRAAAASAPEGSAAALESLSAELARLAERQTSLAARVDELCAGTELVAPSGARIAPSEIEAAVARWMEQQSVEALAAAAPAPADAAQVPVEERVAAALERLDAGGLTDLEWQALWREFAEQGLTDELVAAYEARAAAAPNDPDAQVAVAGAYLSKILEVGSSPEAGLWATKADQALDRALAIDDHHWDARFTKAMSLSFWPPVFGKQGEAIRQFEILVDQQAGLPREERFAETHLLLGNMYRQIGEEEQAMAAWRQGLELYPDHVELQNQLQVFATAE